MSKNVKHLEQVLQQNTHRERNVAVKQIQSCGSLNVVPGLQFEDAYCKESEYNNLITRVACVSPLPVSSPNFGDSRACLPALQAGGAVQEGVEFGCGRQATSSLLVLARMAPMGHALCLDLRLLYSRYRSKQPHRDKGTNANTYPGRRGQMFP